jgi:hypothetical protein
MAIAYIANSGAGSEALATHVHQAFGVSTDSGNLLVVCLWTYVQTPPIVGVGTFDDNRGNTWTRTALQTGGTGCQGAIYYAIAKDTGTVTITATVAGTAYIGAAVSAYTGSGIVADGASSAFDDSQTSTDIHHGNIVTTAEGLIVGNDHNGIGSGVTLTQDANWTEFYLSEPYESACYRITSSSGTYNDGWTLNAGKRWGATGAAFVEAAASGLSILTLYSGMDGNSIDGNCNLMG